MTFNNNTLGSLLSNINQEKTKHITMLYKLKKLLELNEKDGYLLIKNAMGGVKVTEDNKVVYENVRFNHPVIKILKEFIDKADSCINGPAYLVKISRRIIDKIIDLLDNGVGGKYVSNGLRDIEVETMFAEQEAGLYRLFYSVLKNAHLSKLLLQAISETGSFDTEKIRTIKVGTGVFDDSFLVEGLVVANSASGSVKRAVNTSLSLYSCPLDLERTELKGTVLFNNAEELLNYSKDEINRIKEVVDKITSNVLLVYGTVNNTFLDMCNARKILVLKVFSKFDLVRISKGLGVRINEKVTGKHKTFIKEVAEVETNGRTFTKIVGSGKIRTIVLKHSLSEVLDEYEMKVNKILGCLNNKSDYLVNEQVVRVNRKGLVSEVVDDILDEEGNSVVMVDADRKKCLVYALEFIATVLEVNEYLMAQLDEMQIREPPRHFQEDH